MSEFKTVDENGIILRRTWAMPNKNTFSIKPFKELIEKYKAKLPENAIILDPFANSNKNGTITNDIDPQYDTDYHMDAKDFLKMFDDNSIDMVLYDPPFSPNHAMFYLERQHVQYSVQSCKMDNFAHLQPHFVLMH
jgi:hypothetical protein